MAERMIEVNAVQLCTEPFGNPADAPILLVMGLGASMLWWEDGFCHELATTGRFVVRYDHRDTGRSVTYAPGRPGYTSADMVADAVGVLDGYDVLAAHVVGVSAGGALAQRIALDFPERVRSLVLISTSPATQGDRGLPPPTEAFRTFVATSSVDWSYPDSVVDHLVDYSRVLAGDQREFDEPARRALIRRDVERAHNIAALQNHDAIPDGGRSHRPLSSITAPTLVIHGTADPMFPLRHGEALAAEVPNARLLRLNGAGHGVDRADWHTIVDAIVEHTAAQQLTGGIAHAGQVVRVGPHVLRPASTHAASIHTFLRAVRRAGFEGVPTPVGIDDDGRERLAYIDGDVPVPPYPHWSQTDVALASIAKLLRGLHDAARGFDAENLTWDNTLADSTGGTLVCHNDVCPENVVFRDGVAVALLDFEFAAPGRPAYDLAHLARLCVPIEDDLDQARLGWQAADRAARLRLVADAYGLDSDGRSELLSAVDDAIDRVEAAVRRRVEAGEPNAVELWNRTDGSERYDRRRRWWIAHHDEFAAALL